MINYALVGILRVFTGVSVEMPIDNGFSAAKASQSRELLKLI